MSAKRTSWGAFLAVLCVGSVLRADVVVRRWGPPSQ